MRRHPEVPFWLCVGDLATDDGRYEPVDAPIHWIKGNNENFDAIVSGSLPRGLHYLPSGEARALDGVRVAGLGGTFAPTWYETRGGDLPHPRKGTPRATALADKRRHFVSEEVNACKGLERIDVFLTHEAARPYRVGRNPDAGKTAVNEVLAAMRPRLHLFGHHHQFTEQVRQEVRSVGLDLVSRSYLLIDANTLDYKHIRV
jgi:hypothetical protein